MALKLSREIRAVLLLVPALAVVSWLVWSVLRRPAEPYQEPHPEPTTPAVIASERSGRSNPEIRGSNGREESHSTAMQEDVRDAPLSPKLFDFDPNTAEYHDFMRLGFSRSDALGIVKYRARGKVFEIAEDFAACRQVSEKMYLRLRPHIKIGEKYRLKKWPSRTTEVSASVRDTAIQRIVNQHIKDPELVDLNTADSALLVSVRGIGPRTAPAIAAYRERLGGFASVEQLAEVAGVTEQNFALAEQFFYVDPAVITKFNINFAPSKQLARHPYISAAQLRKLLKQRQLKGGWGSLEELSGENIFSDRELQRLAPYLTF